MKVALAVLPCVIFLLKLLKSLLPSSKNVLVTEKKILYFFHFFGGGSRRCGHIVPPHTQTTFISPAPLGLKTKGMM